MKKVIIQGVIGSFHDIAARSYFAGETLELVPANSFPELFESFSEDSSIDFAVIAIENTIAGSIMFNYHLLKDSSCYIIGEVLLRIKQNLLALPGTKINEVQEVHSHYMALAQCREFLDQHKDKKRIERDDTALCAREINEQKRVGIAAIASDLAAKEYGLEIITPSIETNKRNFTRFLILSRTQSEKIKRENEAEKASVCFSLKHETGSLSAILTDLANLSCNLTKIQSVPMVGKEWQYYFFVDFILENNAFSTVIESLEQKVESLQVLGHYKKGQYHES